VNLTAILNDAYRRLRYASAPATAITTRLTAFANETHRETLSLPGISNLRDDTLPWTVVANYAKQGLPPIVARIRGITDRLNNQRLDQVPLGELRSNDPGQLFTGGYALQFAVVGERHVQIQPTSTGSGLWVASSSTSDNGAVRVEAARLGGFQFYDTQTTTLIGTTRVSVKSINATATVTDYIEVERFYMNSSVATGYISLYDAVTGGNTLATIPIGETFARYVTVELWPTPTTAYQVWVDYTRVIPELVNGTDEPLLPQDFHNLIGLGIRAKEYDFLDDDRKPQAMADYAKRQRELKSWVLNNGDKLSSLRQTESRWNSFGPSYPSEW